MKTKEELAQSFACVKCRASESTVGEIRAAGGFASKIFNIQNRKFHTITCKQCGYTEMYKTDSKGIGNVLDFFFG